MINPSASAGLLNAANAHKPIADKVPQMHHDVIIKIANRSSRGNCLKVRVRGFRYELQHFFGEAGVCSWHKVSYLLDVCSRKVEQAVRVWQFAGRTADFRQVL